MKTIEKLMDWGGTKKDILFLVLGGIALLNSMLSVLPLPFNSAWITVVLCGIPIILEAIVGLVTAFDIKADVLVSLALLASLGIGEYFAAGEIAFIMQLGGLLEELTVARARAGIEKLVHLTPRTARIIIGDTIKTILVDQVKEGDILQVQPGGTVPVDGVILSGQTSINQAVLTGESLPVDKIVGDEVLSGTVNQYGAFEMKALKVGKDSSIQRMIQLVQSADAGKAKIVGLADRWATWIVVVALLAAAITWLVTAEIIRAVTILVVFCPCALVLATPTAIMAAIGNATKHGFLVREGDALERLSKVHRIAFDKTGTLTYGTPAVIAVETAGSKVTRDTLYALAASVEMMSEHPLGKAVVNGYRQESASFPIRPEKFIMQPGLGVEGECDGHTVIAGNRKLMELNHISLSEEMSETVDRYLLQGCTIIYTAVNGEFAGFIVLSDTLREESADMIRRLKDIGVEPVLLTGDHENAARTMAKRLGITDCHTECLPEDKLNWIDLYEKQHEPVCMIGDGINDAPALKKAMVGIAMGGVGSDIAIDAADIVLVDDEVKELPHLLMLSRRMMVTIRCNLTFSMFLNFVAIILAITGVLNPVVGALVHNAGSVLVIVNSAVLLRWKKTYR